MTTFVVVFLIQMRQSLFVCLISFNFLFAQNMKTTVDDNNVFAFKLFERLKGEHNLFYSPFSISSALAMTYAGARGETEKQMSHVLCFGGQEELHKSYEKIMQSIESDNGDGIKLNIANSLWAEKAYTFLASYTDLLKTRYHTHAGTFDFVDGPEKVRKKINAWVEQETNDKIKDILPSEAINAQVRLVLVNALYFRGEWANKFNVQATHKDAFYLTEKDTVHTEFMNNLGNFHYYEDEKYQVVELPYKGNKVSMMIFLPNGKNKLTRIDEDFKYSYYAGITDSLKIAKVRITIPKFKTTESFNLSKMLSDMGMPNAFHNADFSGMTGNKDLYVSLILHKAFLDINEKGTEAAASAAVVMTETAERPMAFKDFKADRPFILVIKDNVTGTILFIGEIKNPTKTE
jgi:serpin B